MRRIPWSLIVERKIKRKVISLEFLTCSEADGQEFFSWIITADETWVSFILDWTRKDNTLNGKILRLQERKASESGCCGCDAKMGGSSSPASDVARAWGVFEMS